MRDETTPLKQHKPRRYEWLVFRPEDRAGTNPIGKVTAPHAAAAMAEATPTYGADAWLQLSGLAPGEEATTLWLS